MNYAKIYEKYSNFYTRIKKAGIIYKNNQVCISHCRFKKKLLCNDNKTCISNGKNSEFRLSYMNKFSTNMNFSYNQ